MSALSATSAMSAERRGMLLMAVFVALWASVEALAAGALLRYSPYQVVWTRYVVHLLFMLAIWGWREPASLWRTGRPVFQFARSLLMLGMPASWVISRQVGVEGSTMMAIFWLSPLLILGFAKLFLGEQATLPLWLAALVACLGAWFMTEPSVPAVPALLIFPAGMAVTFSLYVVMTRSLRSENCRANLFYTAFWVALALTPAMPGLWITPPLRDLLIMTGVGLLGFMALFALDRMAAAAPVSTSAPLSCLQLLFSIAAAWVVGHGYGYGGVWSAVGSLLITVAALYVWAREPRLLVRNIA
jgi:drug/metabolite transporter (DMT)-like permease